MLIDQPTSAPTRKVKGAGAAGLVTALCIAAIDHWLPGLGERIGPEIAGLIVAAAATVGGYFTRDRA